MTQRELKKIASEKGLSTATIDKDWILGHFLNAMYSFEAVQQKFIFKGGTCLKKCYFNDYRFSEDLDFTLLDKNFVVDTQFINKIIQQAEKTSGAKFHFERKKLQKSEEIEQGYEIKVKFWGADHKANQRPLPPARWQTYIKLDISFSEKILTKPVKKSIYHEYSDKELINQIIPVYSLHEIISEKLRSLFQRNRPRDIYDIGALVDIINKSEYSTIRKLLVEKAKDKNIKITTVDDFINHEKGNKKKRAWQSSLGEHLPESKLPDFETVYDSIKQFIEKILKS